MPPTTPGSSVPPSFDLSPAYVNALDDEFTRVYEEYYHRLSLVQATCEEIIKLWAELGTPQVQTDSSILRYYRDAPEQLGLHQSDLANLRSKRERLLDEKRSRERKLKDVRAAVEALWDRFGVEEYDRKAFLAANRGCCLRIINEFEEELARLNDLKGQNLHLFVEDARCRLQELWDSLYFSEEDMLDFTPAFSDVCSDALLEAHEAEIARLEALKEQRAPILQLVDKHRELLAEREALSASSQDASRLMARGNKGERRDPGKLLREEKMRKRIAKELPKLETDLRKELEDFEEEYGRPFLVFGERYLDELTPVVKPPPRSKTPSAPPSASKINTVKQMPSRPASAMKAPPPPRSTTRTPTSSVRRNQPAAKSPSKIPARVPLSNMSQGNNCPDRRGLADSFSSHTLNGKMPPPRAPIPSRMRALTADAKGERRSHAPEPPRCTSALSNSLVRPVTPDDMFDDSQPSFTSNSSIFSHRSNALSQSSHSSNSSMYSSLRGIPRPNPYIHRAPPPPAPRQVSNSSSSSATNNAVISGSENWEAFDDASGSETDATEIYHARHRAPPSKRFSPDDSNNSYNSYNSSQNSSLGGKMSKSIRSISPEEQEYGDSGNTIKAGKIRSWTENLETY